MKICAQVFVVSVMLLMIFQAALAAVYSYVKGNTIIGTLLTYTVKHDESLIEIARKFDIGYQEIVEVNPDLDPFVPGEGISVAIPTSWILPDVSQHEGIVINLSEMRLFYFFKQKRSTLVMTFPIGIGREGFATPVGKFRVIEKTVNPNWYVPKSIREEKPELPEIVPPGPDNPLGSHALRLSLGNVLIHGTNKPWGVGRRVSHGCIRLYPEDIPWLFKSVSKGTLVTIVRQPIKVGAKDKNKVFIEVHDDNPEGNIDYIKEAVMLLMKKKLIEKISTKKLYKALEEQRGIPVNISQE
jgi:L,D-transpeptidase ErfK/SrfK